MSSSVQRHCARRCSSRHLLFSASASSAAVSGDSSAEAAAATAGRREPRRWPAAVLADEASGVLAGIGEEAGCGVVLLPLLLLLLLSVMPLLLVLPLLPRLLVLLLLLLLLLLRFVVLLRGDERSTTSEMRCGCGRVCCRRHSLEKGRGKEREGGQAAS